MNTILFCVLLAVAVSTPAISQTVPSGMTYQGRLTNASNAPVPDGTGYEIEVRLWAATSGGSTPLWGAKYTGVPVKSGAFNLILGSPGGTPIAGAAIPELKTVFSTAAITFLGITVIKNATGAPVPSPTEILPRQQIFTSPYAFRSERAASVDPNSVVSSSIQDGQIMTSDLGNAAITTEKLATKAIGAVHIQDQTIGSAQIALGGINMDRVAVEYAEYVDERPAGSNGGSGALNQFHRRVLNKTVKQRGSSILRNGDFVTLQPGSYWVQAYARTYGTNQISVLRDSTDQFLMVGNPEFVAQLEETHSNMTGILEVASNPITFSLATYLTTGSSNLGSFGQTTNFSLPGIPNIFSRIVVVKIH